MAATCPIPPDEEERLKTLHDLDLLDVSYEPSFDRITSLCCQIFDVPIALVSLVDAERQFFKSQRGLGEGGFEGAPPEFDGSKVTMLEELAHVLVEAIELRGYKRRDAKDEPGKKRKLDDAA
ncbi:hypothetical protein SO694_00025355 [Aureococcus anophagefferens]|uniref:Uncharacterized protein n=1 Tax=Aureococcus anophagefferens TaxID=44056 RepID=A0ABR1FV90_AURAN